MHECIRARARERRRRPPPDSERKRAARAARKQATAIKQQASSKQRRATSKQQASCKKAASKASNGSGRGGPLGGKILDALGGELTADLVGASGVNGPHERLDGSGPSLSRENAGVDHGARRVGNVGEDFGHEVVRLHLGLGAGNVLQQLLSGDGVGLGNGSLLTVLNEPFESLISLLSGLPALGVGGVLELKVLGDKLQQERSSGDGIIDQLQHVVGDDGTQTLGGSSVLAVTSRRNGHHKGEGRGLDNLDESGSGELVDTLGNLAGVLDSADHVGNERFDIIVTNNGASLGDRGQSLDTDLLLGIPHALREGRDDRRQAVGYTDGGSGGKSLDHGKQG